MTPDKEETKVIFRVWLPTGGVARETVIAFFPDIDAGRGMCSSYEHVGQHGAADYVGLLSATRPAAPEEYRYLQAELEALGYRLRICKRR